MSKYRAQTRQDPGKMIAYLQDQIDDLKRRKIGTSGSTPTVVLTGAISGAGIVATFDKYVLIPDDIYATYGFANAEVSCIDEQSRAWGFSWQSPDPYTTFYGYLFREIKATHLFEKVLEYELDAVSQMPGEAPGEIKQLCCTKEGRLWGLGYYNTDPPYSGDDTYVIYDLGTSDAPELTGTVEHTLVPSVDVAGLAIDSQDRHWIAIENNALDPTVYAFFCLDGDITLEVPPIDYIQAIGITAQDWLIGPWGQLQVVFAKQGSDHRIGNLGIALNDIGNMGGRFCLDPYDNKLKALASNWDFNKYFIDAEYAYMIYELHDTMLP